MKSHRKTIRHQRKESTSNVRHSSTTASQHNKVTYLLSASTHDVNKHGQIPPFHFEGYNLPKWNTSFQKHSFSSSGLPEWGAYTEKTFGNRSPKTIFNTIIRINKGNRIQNSFKFPVLAYFWLSLSRVCLCGVTVSCCCTWRTPWQQAAGM